MNKNQNDWIYEKICFPRVGIQIKKLKKNLAGKKLFGKKLEILYEALYKS